MILDKGTKKENYVSTKQNPADTDKANSQTSGVRALIDYQKAVNSPINRS